MKVDTLHSGRGLKRYQMILLLIVFSVVVYINSIHGEFISDDRRSILENSHIAQDWQRWLEPVDVVNSWLFHVFGFTPEAYHVPSLMLHAINTILAFFILRIFFSQEASFMGAVLFAVHPIHTEVVSWISGRTYLFVALFVFGGFLLYERATRPGRPLSRVHYLALCFIVLYYMTKQFAYYFFFPFLIMGFDICFGRFRRNWKLSLPLLAYAVVVIFLARGSIGDRIVEQSLQIGQDPGFRNPYYYFMFSFFSHLRLLFAPTRITFYHEPILLYTWMKIVGSIGLVCVGVLLVFLWKRSRVLFFGVFVFTLFLAPTYAPFHIAALVAERYTYIPSILICVVCAQLYEYVRRTVRSPQQYRWLLIASCMVLIAGAARTVARNQDWQTRARFWQATLATSPESDRANNSVGFVFYQEGNYAKALHYFRRARELAPRLYDSYLNTGAIYNKLKAYEKAMPFLKKAIEISPQRPEAHYDLALSYLGVYNFGAGIKSLRRAIEVKPDHVKSYVMLGETYGRMGKRDAALEYLRKAVEVNPLYMPAYNSLGNFYMRSRDYQRALDVFSRALQLPISNVDIAVRLYSNEGVVLSVLNRKQEAEGYFKKALVLNPTFVDALVNLGGLYMQLGRYQEALTQLHKALRIDPQNATAYYSLAQTYFQQQEYDLARQAARKASEFGRRIPAKFIQKLNAAPR